MLDGLLNFHDCMYINLDTIGVLLEASEWKSLAECRLHCVAEVRKVHRTCCPRREFAVLLSGLKTAEILKSSNYSPSICDVIF